MANIDQIEIPSGNSTFTYDIDAKTVNGHTVATDVPANAVFTDTTYSPFTGTDGTEAGVAGLVPAPSISDANKVLKSDGTWMSIAVKPTASDIPFDNTGTGMSATDVQGGITELNSSLSDKQDKIKSLSFKGVTDSAGNVQIPTITVSSNYPLSIICNIGYCTNFIISGNTFYVKVLNNNVQPVTKSQGNFYIRYI